MFALEFNGEPPYLRGQVCEAFLCERFEYAGAVEATANVSYLCFEGRWHRLYFDAGIIFWRRPEEVPQSWEVEKEGWNYPLTDVGEQAGVIGVPVVEYLMEPTQAGAGVVFEFSNGRRIILQDDNDRSHYRIA